MKKIKGLAPIVFSNSKILILGSIPGARSLKLKQYYGHKTNQFWKIIASFLGVETPNNYADKKAMLKQGQIALWDVLETCHRDGSSDASIESGRTNNILKLLDKNPKIRLILLNGRVAEECFNETIGKFVKIPYLYVPSTSSANAGLTLNKKIALWEDAFQQV